MKRFSTFMFAAAVAIIVSSTQTASAELITLNVVPPGGSFQQFNFDGPGPTFVFDNATGTLFDGFRLTVPAGGVTEQVFSTLR